MTFKELLPVGSVVLLEQAEKKVMVVGILPVKHLADGKDAVYDYMGVPYPEGFIGTESGFLFNHDRIAQVCFLGYQDIERELFINAMQSISDRAEQVLKGQ